MYGELRDRIPKEFASVEPLLAHVFSVYDPRGDYWGRGIVSCHFNLGDRLVPLAIPVRSEHLLANAIHSLSRLPRNGYRSAKYLDLYKIYESLEPIVDPDYAVLRHALAHSPEALSRSSTVNRLKGLFGTVRVDFSNRQHVKVFWRLFAGVLVDVDRILYDRIHHRVNDVQVDTNEKT